MTTLYAQIVFKWFYVEVIFHIIAFESKFVTTLPRLNKTNRQNEFQA